MIAPAEMSTRKIYVHSVYRMGSFANKVVLLTVASILFFGLLVDIDVFNVWRGRYKPTMQV